MRRGVRAVGLTIFIRNTRDTAKGMWRLPGMLAVEWVVDQQVFVELPQDATSRPG